MNAANTLTNAKELAVWARLAREAQNKTQSEVALAAGVSRAWLIRFEAGAVRAELFRVFDVLAALGYGLTPQPLREPVNR
ncbi:helix-turn-helix domain-containing protein [Protaetiibacter larvae]|uniref:Helix-turn-helix transcriptional regulator n=1 Tax=Protaetiibacter larvae TaxID=2592654 RepID=A0A5C1Y744_9MICO|nr:helix-turn-helix transcriptional regulator [Protaetiibacter larvae]QEO08995.1 helix-turn-helix transcriptional regulator [Protaetiibacter larvae]